MKMVTLGRTGIVTTAAGLGCGGHSQLGLKMYGEAHAVEIVRKAYDLGVRMFDTATTYNTESVVGMGLTGIPRDSYVISTKFPVMEEWRDNCVENFHNTLNESLRVLKTDFIDVYNFHAVEPYDYEDVKERLVPEMFKARQQGKIRFIGITEHFVTDTSHKTLNAALNDDIFDVIMVGYNMMNPSAVKTILPRAIKQNVGVQCMFAVRRALSDINQMKDDIQRILDNNQGGVGLESTYDALDFLVESGAATSIMDAAYRFCTHTAGVHITLSGTSCIAHLEDNLRSLNSPPLPVEILDKLESLFGLSDCISGQ